MGRPFPVPDPLPLVEQQGQTFPSLVALMQRLLSPDGCPWDREQSFASLRRYVLEEACEVIDAIDGGDHEQLVEELGDLALQVVFLGELLRREGRYGPDDVVRGIVDKLVRRHPHVFEDVEVEGSEEVLRNWETIKANEKAGRGILDGVPRSLPALHRAQRMSEKVSRVGFDWPDPSGSRAKVGEEVHELDEAIASGDSERIEHELGDLLFALVNLARHQKVDAEIALRKSADRFRDRFAHVEARVREQHGGWPVAEDGKPGPGLALDELDGYWEEAKRGEAVSATAELHPVARSPEEWQAAIAALGERPYRAGQIFRAIHARGVLDPAEMTDLPAALRAKLAESGFDAPARVAQVHRSADGTRKLVLEMAEGARVECVLIPMNKPASEADADAAAVVEDEGDDEEKTTAERVTLCISTQFGCAMGCVFCASGQLGLVRGLSAAEIVSQVLIARRHLEPNEYLRNLVFMGMGEPLHHYDQTARAIRLITHPEGIGIGPRRITVSTVGLTPGIRRLGEDFSGKVGLAVSLHAPDDETRGRIVPMNERYPLSELLAALRRYPLPKRRRITIEYTLIDGVNDSPEHARALAKLLAGLRVKVNLIPMNSIEASSLGASSKGRVEAFQRVLAQAGLSCFVRTRRGDEVAAACGQLALSSDLVRERRARV